MQKIPSLFERLPRTNGLVKDVVNPDCQWVMDGEGDATVKWDGTACQIWKGIDGPVLSKRMHLKEGQPKPSTWLHWSFDEAKTHGHGWVFVSDGPEDRWHREAMDTKDLSLYTFGAYELVGPKVQSNPYHLEHHELWKHGNEIIVFEPKREYRAIYNYLKTAGIEGIVYWHKDGRMAKIKSRDFGIHWVNVYRNLKTAGANLS